MEHPNFICLNFLKKLLIFEWQTQKNVVVGSGSGGEGLLIQWFTSQMLDLSLLLLESLLPPNTYTGRELELRGELGLELRCSDTGCSGPSSVFALCQSLPLKIKLGKRRRKKIQCALTETHSPLLEMYRLRTKKNKCWEKPEHTELHIVRLQFRYSTDTNADCAPSHRDGEIVFKGARERGERTHPPGSLPNS